MSFHDTTCHVISGPAEDLRGNARLNKKIFNAFNTCMKKRRMDRNMHRKSFKKYDQEMTIMPYLKKSADTECDGYKAPRGNSLHGAFASAY